MSVHYLTVHNRIYCDTWTISYCIYGTWNNIVLCVYCLDGTWDISKSVCIAIFTGRFSDVYYYAVLYMWYWLLILVRNPACHYPVHIHVSDSSILPLYPLKGCCKDPDNTPANSTASYHTLNGMGIWGSWDRRVIEWSQLSLNPTMKVIQYVYTQRS